MDESTNRDSSPKPLSADFTVAIGRGNRNNTNASSSTPAIEFVSVAVSWRGERGYGVVKHEIALDLACSARCASH